MEYFVLGAIALLVLDLVMRFVARGTKRMTEIVAGWNNRLSFNTGRFGAEVDLENRLRGTPQHISNILRPRKHLCVLIIDDEPTIGKSCTRILASAGYCVRWVTDGREGIAAMKDFRPKVILLDLGMPVDSGWKFRTNQIRLELDDIPTILMSGHPHLEDIGGCLGVDGCVPKPFLPSDLRTKISAVGVYPKDCPLAAQRAEIENAVTMQQQGEP